MKHQFELKYLFDTRQGNVQPVEIKTAYRYLFSDVVGATASIWGIVNSAATSSNSERKPQLLNASGAAFILPTPTNIIRGPLAALAWCYDATNVITYSKGTNPDPSTWFKIGDRVLISGTYLGAPVTREVIISGIGEYSTYWKLWTDYTGAYVTWTDVSLQKYNGIDTSVYIPLKTLWHSTDLVVTIDGIEKLAECYNAILVGRKIKYPTTDYNLTGVGV